MRSTSEPGLVKSPLNYTGGKYRLLPQILPLFPNDIDTFVDAFGGGGNVFANVVAEHHIYNDNDVYISDLLGWMASIGPDAALVEVESIIGHYGLSRDSKGEYFRLRADYNNGSLRFSAALYTLIAHSFNNQVRFNSKGGFNIPFGKREFNDALRVRFHAFATRLDALDLSVKARDYRDLDISRTSFVYCDPPYLITDATYNTAGSGWGIQHEKELLRWLRDLDALGIRWALSNVMDHHGRRNDWLYDFAADYTVTDLSISYAQASYHKKDRVSKSREVLVTNYEPLAKSPEMAAVGAGVPHV